MISFDTTGIISCNDGYIHTNINSITTQGGSNKTNWYYENNGNWSLLNNSSLYITSGQINLNNVNYDGQSTDSISTSISGNYKLEITDTFGNISASKIWSISQTFSQIINFSSNSCGDREIISFEDCCSNHNGRQSSTSRFFKLRYRRLNSTQWTVLGNYHNPFKSPFEFLTY